jgi:hypothetical protein
MVLAVHIYGTTQASTPNISRRRASPLFTQDFERMASEQNFS